MVKIIGVDVFPLALGDPRNGPRGYATQPPWPSIYGNHRETLVVRLTADDGTAGWGEALAPVAPEVPGEIVRRLLAPALLGADPRHVRPLRHQLAQLMRERGHLGGHQADAIAAVDIALWDLAGKLAGLPVVELLGGAFHPRVPTYVSGLPGGDDAERVAYARELLGQDVRQVKVGLGHGVDADLATVEALRRLDARLRIAVDVHGVYDLADALRLGRGLAERGGWFLEAPLAFEDVAGHADLASRLDLPVALGESLRHRWEFQPYVAARAAGILQPDIGRTGITEGIAIAQFAETYHLPVAPHHSAGLGIALAAGLHVAAACANLTAFEWHPSLFTEVNQILTVPIDCTPTSIALPAGPGLGVSVDEDAVARYCTWTAS